MKSISKVIFTIFFLAAVPLCAAPSEEPDRSGLRYALDDNQNIVLTPVRFKEAIAKEIEVRRKFAEPGFFKGTPDNLKDIVLELYNGPFAHHPVIIDPNLPPAERAKLQAEWEAYRAYNLTPKLNIAYGGLLKAFKERCNFYWWGERLDRAKAYYYSSKTLGLLEKLKQLDKDCETMRRTFPERIKRGSTFVRKKLTWETTVDDFFNEGGYGKFYTPVGRRFNPALSTQLYVLENYNEEYREDLLKSIQSYTGQFEKDWVEVFDLRERALKQARAKGPTESFDALIELDERALDCASLALGEIRLTLKDFLSPESKAYDLRNGVSLSYILSHLDGARSNNPRGLNYHSVIIRGGDALWTVLNKAFLEKWEETIPVR